MRRQMSDIVVCAMLSPLAVLLIISLQLVELLTGITTDTMILSTPPTTTTAVPVY